MPHIEVLPSGTSIAQPGYAFVPDTRHAPQAAQPSAGRKRAARNTGLGGGDTTVRQQNVTLKHLADLDRDSSRDVQIPVPKEAAGRVTKSKTTPNVRRILISQKTFANHLADEEAALAQKGAPTTQQNTQNTKHRSVSEIHSAPQDSVEAVEDPLESESLLRTYVPAAPSPEIMQALTTAMALSYNAARASSTHVVRSQRHFCEICGYWGSVRCLKCGARVCGLECKGAHDEGRCLKFYA